MWGCRQRGDVPVPPGRFLVHRYSVLRQHAEATGGDGLDTLDSVPTATKGGYHDDSDEVSAGVLPPARVGFGGQDGDTLGDSGG